MRLAASSASRDETCSGGVRYRNCLYGCRPWPAHESRHEGPPRVASQRTSDSPPPTPEMPTRHAWVSAWQGRRRRARATPALSQSVEVGDIRVVPDAPRNRLGSAAAHQRDDIEGRSDVRKQPAPPGPESGEGAARRLGRRGSSSTSRLASDGRTVLLGRLDGKDRRSLPEQADSSLLDPDGIGSF